MIEHPFHRPYLRVEDFEKLRRLASEFSMRWRAAAGLIKADGGADGEQVIGRFDDSRVAEMVCLLHNLQVPLVNTLLRQAKRLGDIERIERAGKKDG